MLNFIKENYDNIFMVVTIILVYVLAREVITIAFKTNTELNETQEGFNPDINLTTTDKMKCAQIREQCISQGETGCDLECSELLEREKEGFKNLNLSHIFNPKYDTLNQSYSLTYNNVVPYMEVRHSQKINPIQGCRGTDYNHNLYNEVEGFQTIDCSKTQVIDGVSTGSQALSQTNTSQRQKLLQTLCQAKEDSKYDNDVKQN